MPASEPWPHHRSWRLALAITVLLACIALAGVLAGCAVAPPAVVDVPTPVAVRCDKPDPGPKPDLTALAAIKPTDSAQSVLMAVQDALSKLAQDDLRLRALMGQ